MTPKEKVKELLAKFDNYSDSTTEDEILYHNRECAMIAVDLILDGMLIRTPLSFWQKVKKELEKL